MTECIYCGWDITWSETSRKESELQYRCWRCGKFFAVVNPQVQAGTAGTAGKPSEVEAKEDRHEHG